MEIALSSRVTFIINGSYSFIAQSILDHSDLTGCRLSAPVSLDAQKE